MDFLRMMESLRTPFFDAVFGAVTRLGEELTAIAVLCLIYWCVNKRLAYEIGIVYFLSGILVQGLKISFRIPRPFVRDVSLRPVPSALGHATGYSFPSGHTQSAAALALPPGLRQKRIRLRVLLFFSAALVGFSRLYLGVHTPADVLAGFLLTLAISALAVKIFPKEDPPVRGNLILMLVLLLLAAVAGALALALFRSGAIAEAYVSDCFKASGAGAGFAAGMFLERSYIRFPVGTPKLWMQPVKYLSGMLGALALKEGLKPLFGAGLFADALRYAAVLLWISALFPLILQKMFGGRSAKTA